MASPICLPFSASTSHVLGTCAVEKVRGVLSVTERDKQQLLSPSGKPRGNESSWWFFSFCCTANISCTLSGLVDHLHPLDSKKQTRGLPPAGTVLCGPVLQTQHAMVYGAFIPWVATVASVWRVHGTLSSLLFLLLLH